MRASLERLLATSPEAAVLGSERVSIHTPGVVPSATAILDIVRSVMFGAAFSILEIWVLETPILSASHD